VILYEKSLFSDILLVVDYFGHGHTYWAVSTLLLIVLPATIVQMFSMRWYIVDETASLGRWLIHILLLGIIDR
jgi:hypothetical protein